jgi:hypothetical protein
MTSFRSPTLLTRIIIAEFAQQCKSFFKIHVIPHDLFAFLAAKRW